MGFISGLIIGGVVGAIVFYLVLRNNPSIAKKVGFLVDQVDDAIDSAKNK